MPEAYTYQITSVPAGCTRYVVNQEITQWYEGTPPASITLNYQAPCVGIEATLLPDQ